MLKKIKQLKLNSTYLYLAILLLAILLFPIGRVFSASDGSLAINVTPAVTASVFIDGDMDNPITILNGHLEGKVLSEGLHYLIFQDMPGYVTPEPDEVTANDADTNKDPAKTDTTNLGRRVYISAGQTTTVTVNYQKDSELKQLGRTTAETLLYSGGAIRQWSLLRGVAEISADGGTNWQKSIAEVLYVGTTPQAFITKGPPPGGSKYLVAGATTEYYIDFSAVDTPLGTYSGSIKDTIKVTSAPGLDESNKIKVVDAYFYQRTAPDGYIYNSTDCNTPLGSGSYVNFSPTSKEVNFTIQGALRGCNYRAIVKIEADKSITSALSVADTAELAADTATDSAEFTTSVIPPFARGVNSGDIYSKGKKADLGPGGSATYIIGSNGDVSATSESNWILESYSLRSGSTTDFDPDKCTANTSCGAMMENINNMKRGYTELKSGNINSFGFNSGAPEGDVWYSKNSIDIGDGGDVSVNGKGTLLVEGDVFINGNIYSDGNNILGIIVHNGNVIVGSNVDEVDALIYIYSDSGKDSDGAFQTKSNPVAYDKQLKIKGLVVASGYSGTDSSGNPTRTDAFQLGRNYIGDLTDTTKDFTKPEDRSPAELFEYDGRVVSNPPPGFSGRVVRN